MTIRNVGPYVVLRDPIIPDVLLVSWRPFEDQRGRFSEVFRAEDFYEITGVDMPTYRTNVSTSHAGVLRGLHTQRVSAQGKYVMCMDGAIQDVAVDARRGSPTYGRHTSCMLRGNTPTALWVPPGFLHGFLALEASIVMYQCSSPYDAESAVSVRWNDPALGIRWLKDHPNLSEKDANAPLLKDADL